ncbi:hypothetical protein BD408DRAFT_125695 [Parasitella parasitica]|nr:hypothetical protein BD408DRAFT_125695 [Parasitella parasitica]
MEDVVGLGDLEGRASTLVSTMAKVSVRDDAAAITALNAQDCKFDVRFSAAPAMKTNCICVPIVVQNVLCFGLVDSGATFSCITNEFFTFLGGQSISSFKPDSGIVQLGHVSSSVSRVGSVDLNLFYNKYAVKNEFEVFDFYSNENVHVLLLGLDILSKIGIGITGLVSQHFTQVGPKIPDPIDPDHVKPNNDPYVVVKLKGHFLRNCSKNC